MDIGALKQPELTAWVPMDDDVQVLLRFLSREELTAIGKQAVVTTFNKKTRKPEQEYDAMLADQLIGEAAIVDWRGLECDGAAFPCTQENVAFLMRKWGEFARFVNTACVDLRGMVAQQRDSTEKN